MLSFSSFPPTTIRSPWAFYIHGGRVVLMVLEVILVFLGVVLVVLEVVLV